MLAAPVSGCAANPYVTDDTGTQGAGKWQLELLAESTRHARTADAGPGNAHQVRRASTINPVLSYGVLGNLDIALGLNRARQRIIEDGLDIQSAHGAGDSTLELKWRFYERDGLSLALKPGLVLPTGDENQGLGTGRLSWGANFILAREAGSWAFLANVAYTQARYKRPADAEANHAHLWRVSAGFGYALREDLRLAGEAGVRTNAARDDPFLPGRNGHFAMLGLIYSPSERIDLDAGIRTSFSRGEIDKAFLLGAALRW